ncbi:MAG: adenylyl-sulfate kinase [Methylobacterium frigidaeris]
MNAVWQNFDVSADSRVKLLHQQAAILWFTGLSGAGKTTTANLLQNELHASGRNTYILDGDNLRHGLNRDLGFSDADRSENMRRTAEVARLFADAGLIVIVSLISPFRKERAMAREIAGGIPFHEIHFDAPLAVCERRDPKGLYRRARCGEIPNFTGIDSAYEAPLTPDLRIDSGSLPVEDTVDRILELIRTPAAR